MKIEIVGAVKLFAFEFEPTSWLLCDGKLVSISKYRTLFQIIGTKYGGDGVDNFALPNLIGMEPTFGMKYFICYNGQFPTIG
jgi:microcystin-dependent protein